ncbi:MAG: hypothetical protein JNJ60_17900 [Rhodocyclaceae bacterium]|nr:hypothetical protein [Rhodocyclaceae bacterium]
MEFSSITLRYETDAAEQQGPAATVTLEIDAGGLCLRRPGHEFRAGWEQVARIELDAGGLAIEFTHAPPLQLPAQAFAGEAARAEWLAAATALRDGAAAVPPTAAPAAVPGAPAASALPCAPIAAASAPAPRPLRGGALRALARDVLYALRLALFLAPRPADPPPHPARVVAALLVSFAIPLLFDFAHYGLAGRFAWESSSSATFPAALVLVTACACALAVPARSLWLLQAFALAAAAVDALIYTLLAVLMAGFSRQAASWAPIVHYLPALWLGLACARAATAGQRTPGGGRNLYVVLCCAAMATVLTLVPYVRDLWYPLPPRAENRPAPRAYVGAEEHFYAQPAVLARELAALQPRWAGRANLYFIGVAGYAQQDVFMREVQSVEALFAERWHSQGHTLKLVNNPATLSDIPIATVTSLRAALARTAELMDKEHDLLFLFMTSHGSEDHHFVLEFPPLRLQGLNPKTLRELLDQSGIRHRVVVVSACYSGGFVDALRDPDTLVIAASAPDKNSFGCSNTADWTYFGKAYFDEALRSVASFAEAFEKALPLIAEREKSEGYTPSDPRMDVGANMAQYLDQFRPPPARAP